MLISDIGHFFLSVEKYFSSFVNHENEFPHKIDGSPDLAGGLGEFSNMLIISLLYLSLL